MRIITSPVPELPGTIELPDFLTLPQVIKYRDTSDSTADKKNWDRAFVLLPVQLEITGAWNIQGVESPKPNPETFPFTPAQPASFLLSWLHIEIVKMIAGEKLVPNASRPRSTRTAKTPAKRGRKS